ncbi:NADH-quinone oxidoreductase subunit N [Nocardioides iriomotensis]|uniref:NADH-quinone oxidoreductase subunit N n=1 Tax=Nocardioides iriomotensis TaxID=715784 RepID=A0A4Q5J800_9ACTN|nr:NADH-quinone oxidoreductase subunit N [Nocardioides iriomotensis]RYU14852.1 NADH-quinone oxidoreductase subunit N [Nocardioides iriomotensis]
MNLVQSIDWLAIAAPTVLAVAAVVVLLVDAFLPRPLLPATLTLLAVLAAAVPTWVLWGDPAQSTFCTGDALEGPELCSFSTDAFTLVVWGIVLFGTAVVTLIGTAAVADGRTPAGEWHFLLLCSAAGAVTLAASRDLVTLLVALEVVSLPAFALAGLRRGDPRAAEAAVKFFLVSVVATAITLMGISLLYGVTGSVFLDGIAAGVATGSEPWSVLVVGALLTVVGLAFKVAAVPFHMWVPDTYVGAPVAVAAYLSVVSKAAGFVGLMLVLGRGLPGLADTWAPVVAILAALTMTAGNVLALRQTHAVRLLAWSSVAQAGYILVPFGAVTPDDVGPALSGSLGYLAVYAIVNLTAFAVAAVVGTRHPAQRLADYRGLVKEEPGAGWPLAFALVALAGLPPGVIGLLAKVLVFDAASRVTWLVVVMAVNVAIGLVYYAAWLRELFRPAAEPGDSTYDVPNGVGVAIGMTFVAGVLFSVLPGWLLDPVLAALG